MLKLLWTAIFLRAKGIEAERLKRYPKRVKQGVKIDDKHVGVIIKFVRIVDPGHTIFLQDEIVSRTKVMEENKIVEGDDGVGATFESPERRCILTVVSSASFQETTKILTIRRSKGKLTH